MTRRDLLRLAGAACLAMPFTQARADDDAMLEALGECLNHHRRFRACFASKFRSGTCRYDATAERRLTGKQVLLLTAMAFGRLAVLSQRQRTGALLYHVRNGGGMDVFLLGPDGLMKWHRVDADVEALAGGLRHTLSVGVRSTTRAMSQFRRDEPTERALPTDMDQASAALLPGDLARIINAEGFQRLLVLPSGPVGQFPFPALQLGQGRSIAEQASVLHLADHEALFIDPLDFHGDVEAALQAMNFDPRHALAGAKLLVGNPVFENVDGWILPPLPGAESEVRAVADVFTGGRVLLGHMATRDRIMREMRRFQMDGGIAYFATHGISDPVNPMDGSFLATADGAIRGQDIRRLKMSNAHPLVVMSACQTGLGKTFGGGAYGLARAWYSAGAGQVIGSLWNVSDEGTSFLMSNFARTLVANPRSTEEALRLAMLKTRDAFAADPAIWASFTVLGNPSA
ncbi:MAG: CHAT domain-containing protein [Mesorhizobium sp.]